jgi:type II secretory pathway pseudopilin PulG
MIHGNHYAISALRHRRGAVLLEVIVALAILSIAALSAVILARQGAQVVAHAQAADQHIQAASAFMDVVSLWPRADLDRRLGDHPQGPWTLHIDRPTPTFYRIALSDSLGGSPLLETALFRAVPPPTAQ